MNISILGPILLGSVCGPPWIVLSQTSSALHGKTVITFEEIDAQHDMVVADKYLQKFGITISDVTPGTHVVIVNDKNLYEGRTLRASSGHNLLTQANSIEPMAFTLTFGEPLESVEFTRPQLIAGANGITFPEWSAEALDENGKVIGKPVGEPLGRGPDYYHDVPARIFRLTGPHIKALQFHSNNHDFAAFGAVLIDDLMLETKGNQ